MYVHLLFIIYYLLYIIYYLLFIIQLFINYLLFNYLLFIIFYSITYYLLFIIIPTDDLIHNIYINNNFVGDFKNELESSIVSIANNFYWSDIEYTFRLGIKLTIRNNKNTNERCL